MGKYPQSVETCIAKLKWHLENEEVCTARTVRFYIEECKIVFDILKTHNSEILPYTVQKTDIIWLLKELERRKLTVSTRRGYISSLRKICKYYNNKVFDELPIHWPRDTRPTVSWLSEDQARTLIECVKTPKEEMLIHLELCMGLRRIEVARLRVDDIHDGYIDVLGKGPLGGKPRTVPFHPDTLMVLKRFFEDRNEIIKRALKKNPDATIPKELFIHRFEGDLFPYSTVKMTAMNDLLKQVSKRVGFSFSHHTLRRTFGRLHYRNKTPIGTISVLLGHDDPATTMIYLGIDMDDMIVAMNNFPVCKRCNYDEYDTQLLDSQTT